MMRIAMFFHRRYLNILMFLSIIRSSSHHSQDNIVNFNDVQARIDRIEKDSGKVYYGDIPSSFKIERNMTMTHSDIILRPFNGFALFYNSLEYCFYKPQQQLECKDNQRKFVFGPMSDQGFWGFGQSDGYNSSLNFLENILIIDGDMRSNFNISQKISLGKRWTFVQMFEWEAELFACFITLASTLVVMRFKNAPQNSNEYGTFISSFYVDSVTDPQAFFLPSYEEPVLYYYSHKRATFFILSGIKLRNVIKKMDEGFQKCESDGFYPANFFKLQPYIENLAQEFWKPDETGKCKKEIPIFYFNETIEALKLNQNILVTESMEIYSICIKFNVRIFSYIEQRDSENSFDVRCYLDDLEDGTSPDRKYCTKEKVQYKLSDSIVSIYWDFDSFSLTRWFKSGMKKFRLLDCGNFSSCALCTLYGAFECEWNSNELNCVQKYEHSVGDSGPCYLNVTASKKIVENGEMELIIELPHELDVRAGEEASVYLDGERFSDVWYDRNEIYRARMVISEPTELVIAIRRGDYSMSIPFKITRELDSKPPLVIYLTVGVIILAFVTAFLVYSIVSDRQRRLYQFETSTTSPSPVTIRGLPTESSPTEPRIRERINAISSSSTANELMVS